MNNLLGYVALVALALGLVLTVHLSNLEKRVQVIESLSVTNAQNIHLLIKALR